MFVLLGFIVIVGTLVIARRQGENEMGKVFIILLCGVMLLSAIAKLKYA